MKKKLLTKEQVYEFFNPVLDGNTINSTGAVSNINIDEFDNFYDRPKGLDLDHCEDEYTDEGDYPISPTLSLSSTFINGKPLTDWSARFLNHPGSVSQAVQLTNMYSIYTLIKTKFPNGFKDYLPKVEVEETSITNIKIINIEKKDGINITFNITFDLNEFSNIWCKIENFNNENYTFICSEINKLKFEDKLKIEGKIINTIKNFLKAESGYYILMSKEFYVFTTLGQIHKLHEGEVVELINSTSDKINIRKGNKQYIIKKPDYYYFNWLFTKK